MHEWPARAARSDPDRVRARRGPRLQGLRRVVRAPTSRSRPAGRPCTRCCSSTTAGHARTSSTTTSPSSSRRAAERALGRADLRQGPALHLREPVAARSFASATARPASVFQLGVDHAVYQPRDVERAPATRSSSTAAPSRRGARCRSGCSRWPSCIDAGRTCGSCCSATPSPRTRRSPTSTSACLAGAARRGSTRGDRRAVPVDDELLADAEGDARLRAPVRRPRGLSAESIFGEDGPDRARARSARARSPTHIERLLDDPRPAWRRSLGGRPSFVADHTWEAATDEVERACATRSGCARRRSRPLRRSSGRASTAARSRCGAPPARRCRLRPARRTARRLGPPARRWPRTARAAGTDTGSARR